MEIVSWACLDSGQHAYETVRARARLLYKQLGYASEGYRLSRNLR